MDKIKAISNKKGTVIAVILVIITLLLTVLSTYAWYKEEIEAAYQLDVDASGVLYLYVEAPIKPINSGEEDERTLIPARAMAGAVANGLRLNPMELYDTEVQNPSYVERVAIPVTYKDKFILQQATGTETDVNYDISVKSTHDSTAIKYDSAEFIFTEVSFSYWHIVEEPVLDENGNLTYDSQGELITRTRQEKVNPLLSQTEDKTSGVLHIADAQNIDFVITVYLAKVDELIDDSLFGKSVWIEISLVAQIEEI